MAGPIPCRLPTHLARDIRPGQRCIIKGGPGPGLSEELCGRYFLLNLEPVVRGNALGRRPIELIWTIGPWHCNLVVGFWCFHGRCPKHLFLWNYPATRREQSLPCINDRRKILFEHGNDTMH